MNKYLTLLPLLWFLTACIGGDDRIHEYELSGTVAEVISCDKQQETCKATVYKGEKEKYKEIWTIVGKIQKGDKVYRTCRFQKVEIIGKDDAKSAGLSSRSTVEKELDNSNCDDYGYST